LNKHQSRSTVKNSIATYQTIGYFGGMVILGLFSSALGPTLGGLAENTGSGFAKVSLLFTARSFGYLLGSLRGGRLYDRLPGHPVLVTVLLVMAVAYLLTPLIPFLWLLTGLMLLVGFAEGTLDVGSNAQLVWVRRRTGDRHGVEPYMNALHFFFGFGAFIGPLLIGKVLGLTGFITFAYWLLALCALPVAAWIVRLPSPARDAEEQHGPLRTVPGMVIGLIVLFFFLYVGAEVAYAGWISSYVLALGLADASQAAYLASLFWGAFMVGRLLGIPIAMRFRAYWVLVADLAGCLVSLLVLLRWPDSITAVFVCTVGLGLAMASIFPTMINWAEHRMTLTGRTAGYFFTGAGAGGMVLPWVVGQFFESQGAYVMVWIVLADMLLCIISFSILVIYNRSLSLQSSAV